MVTKKAFQTVNIPAGLEGWVAHRLVSAHQRILKLLIAGHLLNIGLLALVFYGEVSSLLLFGAVGAVVATCAHRWWLGERIRSEKAKVDAQQSITAMERNTLVLGGIIAITITWLMPGSPALKQVFLAIAATSHMAAAGYTMRTLPRAALAYIAILGVGVVFGVLRTRDADALAICALIIASSLLLSQMAITAHRLFVIRILKERDATAASETVRLLLNDYEDQGSDWLFELTEEGKLYNVSNRFAEATGLTVEMLNGREFASLFTPSPEVDQLRDHMAERRAFRSLTLSLQQQGGGDVKWWSASGRPANGGPTSLVRFRGVICDISAEKQAEARVRHLAHYDSLTELPNRLKFTLALNRAFAETNAPEQQIAALYVDVDNFKSINDMFGHLVGDAFLRTVAGRLQRAISESHLGSELNLAARLGGDEFAVMLIGRDAGEQVSRLAERIVTDLAQPYTVQGHEINSSVSIGIAIAPQHANSAQVLLSNADIALYAANDRGRNQWQMFATGMDTAVQERHALERDLRSALTNEELRLYLQPLVDVESGQEAGFEALVRWQHPVRGLVAPLDFIPVAEESGLIVPIGEWVLRTAIREAASWDVPMTIAVNLSPVQLRSANLLPTVINALGESGLDPSRLELEITEGVLMHDSEANIATLNRLHALGVKIALDDFGTGYASLNYLLTFPFDKIKIDRSFVTDLETRQDCREIVGAVIGLANRLGMCTLAEGVEQEAQLIKLREQGCEMVQGWLFGKALPAEHYGEQLRGMSDAAQAEASAQQPRRRHAA